MLALRDLQAAFVAHLVEGERADLLASVVGDSIPAAARLRVHRHHVFDSLAEALAATFSTVQRLVGDEFLRRLARSFVAAKLPTQPVLSEYGADFADFVERYAPAQGLPYLADVARLDWALNVAFHSPAGARLAGADLAIVPGEHLPRGTLGLAPGTALLCSAYPLDRIWAAAQPGAPDEAVELGASSARLLVFRRSDDAGFIALSEGEAAFASSLLAGAALERATEAAFAAEMDFDLSKALARFLSLQVFAALQHI